MIIFMNVTSYELTVVFIQYWSAKKNINREHCQLSFIQPDNVFYVICGHPKVYN